MGGKTQNGNSRSTGGASSRSPGNIAINPAPKGELSGGGGMGCDIHLDVDLASVRADVISGLRVGDELDVALRPVEGFEAVACLDRPAGRIAGTLANVEGLDRLIGCLRSGHLYCAVVMDVGSLHCHVVVDPAQT